MIYPYALTCGRVETPLGIAGTPTFSWKLRSEEKDQCQRAYRIQAASAPELLPTPDLWDSGEILSNETLDIPWGSLVLPSFARVYWRVTIWDRDGIASASEPAWFETGVNPGLWIGKTVYAGDAPDQPYAKTAFATTAPALDMPPMPAPGDGQEMPMPDFTPKPKPEYYFRREFQVDASISRARLYLTASAACLVRLNGMPAGDWLNDPSPNMCSFRPLYTPYDITGCILPGANALAISCAGANIAVIVMLEDSAGRQTILTTDSHWKWTVGPTQMIGTGERFNANRELKGWDMSGYNDSKWASCRIGPDPLTEVWPNLMHPQRVVRSEHPAAIEKTSRGTFRCRASQITAGRVRFRLSAPKGMEIRLYLAEKELQNGEIIRGKDPLGNPEEGGEDCFTYVFSGDGVEEWAARYSYSGIGWLEIIGYPGEIHPEDIWFEAVLNDSPGISSMESSEPMFLQLHNALVNTIQNNFHGVLTTCPPYEKGPADGDTSVTLPAFLWNLDCLPILRRLDDDFAATVRFRVQYTEDDLKQGRIAPGMIRTVPEWSSMLVHNCKNLRDMCGLSEETAIFYEELKRYFSNEIAELRFSDYLVDSFFGGDWNSPDGNGAPEGGTLSGTCYEFLSLRVMAELCEQAGFPEDAALYLTEAEKIKSSINEKCLSEDEYQTAVKEYFPKWGPPPYGGEGQKPLPVGYRQTSNLLPLAFGIAPEEKRAAILSRLVQEIHKNGDHLNTGFVGAKYLLTTLSDLGHLELSYTIATKKDYPSWGYWLEHGATTCWEQWGTFSRSYDHYFLAAGLEDWFRETLAGIRDAKDGYKTFTIRPQIPEQLTRFGMSSETARGMVSSRWEKTADGITLEVVVPVGSTANVILPAGAGHIVIDGTPSTSQEFLFGSGARHITWKADAS